MRMNIYGKPVSFINNEALLATTLTIFASVAAVSAQGQQAPVPGDLPAPAAPTVAPAVKKTPATAILQPAQTPQFDTATERPTAPPKRAGATVTDAKKDAAVDATGDDADSATAAPAAPAKSKWLTMPKMPKIHIPMYHYFPKDQDPGEMRDMTKDKDEPMHAPGMNGGSGGTTASEASAYADGKRSSDSIMSGNDGTSSTTGTGHGAGAAVIDTDEDTPYPMPAKSGHGAQTNSSVKKAIAPVNNEADDDEPKPVKHVDNEWRKKDPAIFYRKAVLLTKEKLYNEALIEINKCLQLNPHYVEARYQGAYISQLQGHFAEAIRHYEKIVESDPHHLQAHINLGVCYRHEKRLDEAEDEYRKAIEISFYSLQAHYNLANVLIEQNEFEGALKELKACSKIAPNNPSVHNNLGVIYQKRGYFEEAEEEFLRALTLEPANKSFERNLESVRALMKKKTVTS
jgi:Tfp pilus assembly protein PilF